MIILTVIISEESSDDELGLVMLGLPDQLLGVGLHAGHAGTLAMLASRGVPEYVAVSGGIFGVEF